MAAILIIFKRYLFEILCGVGAGLAILLAVLGLRSTSTVAAGMTASVGLYNDLTGLARGADPVNKAAVEQAQHRIDRIKEHYKEALGFAETMNRFAPLMEGVFPSPSTNQRLEFQQAYRAETRGWLERLKAGGIPTEDDVNRALDRIKTQEPDKELGADTAPSSGTPGGTPGGAPGGTPRDPNKTDQQQYRDRAEVAAALAKARSLQCYATRESFQQSEVSRDKGPMESYLPPSAEQMWYAQLEVWLQRDMVDAIARINGAAAERLKASGGEAWVGTLPIKELVSIQTSEYYIIEKSEASPPGGAAAPPSGGGRPTGSDAARYPVGTPASSFTGGRPSDLYDVMQFRLRMIVDARELPAILGELSRNRFHTPIRVQYEAVPPTKVFTGKIYGDSPVVEAVVDFETIFLTELYISMMPDEVLTKLGKTRPQPDKGPGA